MQGSPCSGLAALEVLSLPGAHGLDNEAGVSSPVSGPHNGGHRSPGENEPVCKHACAG